jgi:hypothetical protein
MLAFDSLHAESFPAPPPMAHPSFLALRAEKFGQNTPNSVPALKFVMSAEAFSLI